MRFALVFLIVLMLCPVCRSEDLLVREADAQTPEDELADLRVPEGFSVQLFAAEPMINKPINVAFDQEGRLWVSSTVEYPYAAKRERWSDGLGTKVKDSRDAIKILEDTDGDGSADQVRDFADGLNIPTGVLPWHRPDHQMGCIAWSIPNIWYFADTTGDGVCDTREFLYGPMGFEKDTHGMCSNFRLGGDGWVYATHGFNNTSRASGKDGHVVEMNSGNVFRFRTDGSRIEVYTTGQVNPFGLCFDRRGNLYSADCHSAPVYQLLHGADYPHFGKTPGPLGFGPTMIEHTHGSTGICGIVYLDRNVWGEEWNNTVLIGNAVTSRINRDSIRYNGTTPVAKEDPDFVVSKDPWFRPVDLQVGPDGALYVADFYNRIIGHYEVPLDHPGRDRERGRIWRIEKRTGVTAPMPPFERKKVADAIGELGSENPFRVRAAAAALQESPDLSALEPLRLALNRAGEEDTHLRHVLRLALAEHLNQEGAFATLIEEAAADPNIRQIALAVPTRESARFLLSNRSRTDADTARHIARFGDEDIRGELILATQESDDFLFGGIATLESIITGLEEGGNNTQVPMLLDFATEIARRLLGERERMVIHDWTAVQTNGSENPWTLQERKAADGTVAMVLSSLRRGEPRAEQRTGVMRSKRFPAPDLLSFWLCGHRGFPDKEPHEDNYVRLVLADSGREIVRAYPPRSDVCRQIEWPLEEVVDQPVQLEIVDGDEGRAFAWLGIARVEPRVVKVEGFAEAARDNDALSFLADYLKVSAPSDLREELKLFLPPAPAPPPRIISENERKQLDQLIAARTAGFNPAVADLEKGKQLFQVHCSVCHRVDGAGGVIGPQLDGIGTRGASRIAEDIIDPSRNVDAHFYLTTLTLKDGSKVAGFLSGERGELIQLTDPAGMVHRYPKSKVTSKEVSAQSLMPPVFGQILGDEDFCNLLGWLLRHRPVGQ